MTTPRRLPDWPARLSALVVARLGVPFAWGPHDCASFVADAYEAMTGQDGLQELRGTRRTERQARRQIRAGGGIPSALARAGLQEVAPGLAQRGDLVLLALGGREVMAVCQGPDAMAHGAQGLQSASMAFAVRGWRV